MPGLDQLWRWLADAVPDALLLVGPRGRIDYANPYAHTVFGYQPGTLGGLGIEALVPPESRQHHAAHRSAYAGQPTAREMGNRTMALFGLRADGSQFPAEIRLSPLPSTDRMLTAAVVRDVSGHRRLESELEAARDLANRANEGKSRFLAAVSHDLRQPLQTLRMLTATVRRQGNEAEREASWQQVDRALNSMSELVNAVLNVAKLESGTVEPEIQCCDVSALFEDLRAQLAPLAEAKNLRWTIVASDLQLQTDRALLRQVLQNLVSNAIRYTDSGQITLRARAVNERLAEITVEDTGIGIPASALSTIFEDFTQVPRPGEAFRGGVGLGLGTVRRIAKLLGLAVRVESTVGVGSQFIIEVPTTLLSDAPESPPSADAPRVFRPSDHMVVFIEDDAAVRHATVLYLEKVEGYRVKAAASIDELKSVLTGLSQAPALVVSDFQLGYGMFGTDALSLVRDTYGAQVPAIMLTGDTSAIAQKLAAIPRTALLSKPVNVEALTKLMAEMIGSGRPG